MERFNCLVGPPQERSIWESLAPARCHFDEFLSRTFFLWSMVLINNSTAGLFSVVLTDGRFVCGRERLFKPTLN
jgi:hypothetical protein